MANENLEILIIGIGNPFRGDDAAGLLVARGLLAETLPGVVVKEATGDAAALMDAWEGFNDVTLVDAVNLDGHPRGEVMTFTGGIPLPCDAFACSTHSFGLNHAIELARALGTLPKQLVVIGIVGTQFEPSETMLPGLEPAVSQVIYDIKRKVLTHA